VGTKRVEYGADATVLERDQSTSLHAAVRRGSVGLTRLLIEYGKDGVTPLHLAVRKGRVDLARLLVDHGTDTMAKDKDGSIPLHLVAARESGGAYLARFLVEQGVDATAHWQDNRGREGRISQVSMSSMVPNTTTVDSVAPCIALWECSVQLLHRRA